MANQPTWVKGWHNGQVAVTDYAGCITFPAGATAADLLDTIDAFITARGWTLYDAAAGANARCYRAPNVPDAIAQVDYGYVVIDLNTANTILTKVYESWNAGTHVGTNLAYFSDNATYALGISLAAGGQLNISVDQRHLLFGNYTGGSINAIIGVYELSPAHDADLVAGRIITKKCFFSTGVINSQFDYCGGVCRVAAAVGNAVYTHIITDYGLCGRVITGSINTISLIPAFNDNILGRILVSHGHVGGRGAQQTETGRYGTMLGLIWLGRTQGAVIGDDIQLPVAAEAAIGGELMLDHDGVLTPYWVFGVLTNGLRIAVRK